ncbi:MAG: hypothetical protein WCF95_07720 [bacterium]
MIRQTADQCRCKGQQPYFDLKDRNALSNLFPKNGDVTPADILNVIRWKDIYSDLEDVIDACEDVADYMESMLLTVS